MNKLKVIILDDDPTGTQTVVDVPVLTVWDEVSLTREMLEPGCMFFILTNTRAMTQQQAYGVNVDICQKIIAASAETLIPFIIISRSDSTLRGYFPAEPDAIETGLERTFDAWFIIPFFEEGGRITKNNIHYVKEGEKFVPVADTPFAKDASFGFTKSDLTEWVQEKTQGRVKARDVVSISLEELNKENKEALLQKILNLNQHQMVIVNATTMNHLRVLAEVVLAAVDQGKHFLFRTAASWVKAIKESVTGNYYNNSLIPGHHLKSLHKNSTGGLVVVGSYVPKTTEQLNIFLETDLSFQVVELNVEEMLASTDVHSYVMRYCRQIDEWLRHQKNVIVFTSRRVIEDANPDESLQIINRVSHLATNIVKNISVNPQWIIAKGGITSSDIATKALCIKRAIIAGSLLPGVPVWIAGDESKFPGLCYVVFPGNVGDSNSLLLAVKKLCNETVPV